MPFYKHNLSTFMQKAQVSSILSLSKQTGIPNSTLQRFAKKGEAPKHKTLKTLASYFDTTVEELLGFSALNLDNLAKHNVAYNIKLLMERQNIKDLELSQAIGITAKSINDILNERTKTINIGHIEKIANFFNVTVENLRGVTSLEAYNSSIDHYSTPFITWKCISPIASQCKQQRFATEIENSPLSEIKSGSTLIFEKRGLQDGDITLYQHNQKIELGALVIEGDDYILEFSSRPDIHLTASSVYIGTLCEARIKF